MRHVMVVVLLLPFEVAVVSVGVMPLLPGPSCLPPLFHKLVAGWRCAPRGSRRKLAFLANRRHAATKQSLAATLRLLSSLHANNHSLPGHCRTDATFTASALSTGAWRSASTSPSRRRSAARSCFASTSGTSRYVKAAPPRDEQGVSCFIWWLEWPSHQAPRGSVPFRYSAHIVDWRKNRLWRHSFVGTSRPRTAWLCLALPVDG